MKMRREEKSCFDGGQKGSYNPPQLRSSVLNRKFLYEAVEVLHEYMWYVNKWVVDNSIDGNSHADWL
jgi:hypothetical protein